MKKYLYKTFLLLISSTLFLPSIAFAQGQTVDTDLGNNISNFGQFLERVFAWGIPITAGIAVIMFMFAGYLYMTSQGDSGKIGEAKEIIIGVIVGVMLLFTIGILMRNVIGTLSSSSTPTVAVAPQIRGSATSNLQKAVEALKTSTNPLNQNLSNQIQATLDKLKSGAITEADAAKQIQAIGEQLKKNGSSDVQSIINSVGTAGQVLEANTILQQMESMKPEDAKILGDQLQTIGVKVGTSGNTDLAQDLQRIAKQLQVGADTVKLIQELEDALNKANTAVNDSMPADTINSNDQAPANAASNSLK